MSKPFGVGPVASSRLQITFIHHLVLGPWRHLDRILHIKPLGLRPVESSRPPIDIDIDIDIFIHNFHTLYTNINFAKLTIIEIVGTV